MDARTSVDLLGTNCAPPNIESIVLFFPKSAHMWGCTIAEHCEALGTSCIGSHTINKSSMESLHGFNKNGCQNLEERDKT